MAVCMCFHRRNDMKRHIVNLVVPCRLLDLGLVCLCLCVCVFVCVRASMHVCVRVYVYMYVYTCAATLYTAIIFIVHGCILPNCCRLTDFNDTKLSLLARTERFCSRLVC